MVFWCNLLNFHTHRFPVSTFPVIRKDKERADCVTQDTMVNDVNQTTVSSNSVFLVCTSKLGILQSIILNDIII